MTGCAESPMSLGQASYSASAPPLIGAVLYRSLTAVS